MITYKTLTKRILQDNHYVITESGAVWSHKRDPKPLKTTLNRDDGYKQVTLCLRDPDNRRKTVKIRIAVHRLVCLWFHGEPPTVDHVVNHKDLNKLNNHKDNVEWVTQQENVIHYLKSVDNRKG